MRTTTRITAVGIGSALTLALTLVGCAAAGAASREPRMVDVGASVEPIRAWFDAHADRPRAIALLSPT